MAVFHLCALADGHTAADGVHLDFAAAIAADLTSKQDQKLLKQMQAAEEEGLPVL